MATTGALAAFSFTYHLASKLVHKNRLYTCLIFTLLALPAASFSIYYLHIFPEDSWYYDFRSIPGSELLIIFLGVAGGLWASLLPRALLSLSLMGTLAFSIAPTIKNLVRPLDLNSLQDKSHAGVCLQSTPSTCGPASLTSILRHHDIKASEKELAVEAHSYDGGTEAWYLARAARKRGCEVNFHLLDDFSSEVDLPVIVGVRLRTFGHFIAILGREGEKFILADPLQGREVLSLAEMRDRYVFTGFHMSVSK
ncbi:MAG: C39 family peptidase [Lentisphaeraceae bacterium]|nr:C39 family peptidase [Lentisphaeraceae bacterium]